MNIIKTILLTSVIVVITFYLYSYVSKKETIDQKQLIKNILSYSMPIDIIKRCQKDHNYTDEDMVILEKELKKYFVFSAINTKQQSGVGMYSKDVDNLWHTFILFTKDYANFCKNYIHHFVHHVPETNNSYTPEKLAKTRQNFQAFIKKYEDTFHEEIHPVWLLDMCENNMINAA